MEHLVGTIIALILLSLSHTSPSFYVSALQAFLKHSGKRRNCSYRAISPFSRSIFNPFEELPSIVITFEIVICRLFQFGRVLKFVIWERVKGILGTNENNFCVNMITDSIHTIQNSGCNY